MLSAKRIYWSFGLVLAALIIFLPRYTKLQELKDKNRELEVKIDKVKLENAVLENELARIEKDPVYQEEIIRDKLGVVRKGEVVYKIEENSRQ
ncbi:MAG: septum formation initiator family protein [Candidatus Omnitrophota bacterium]